MTKLWDFLSSTLGVTVSSVTAFVTVLLAFSRQWANLVDFLGRKKFVYVGVEQGANPKFPTAVVERISTRGLFFVRRRNHVAVYNQTKASSRKFDWFVQTVVTEPNGIHESDFEFLAKIFD